MYVGYIAVLVGVGFLTGQTIAGIIARSIGKTKYQIMVHFFIGGIFLGCAATVTPDNKQTQIALLFLGCYCVGYVECLVISNTIILIPDQREVGVAGGLGGCVRMIVSSVLQVVYVTVLTNRLNTTIAERVPSALTGAGLPSSSVAGFMNGLPLGSFAGVSGVTADIIQVGMRAYKQANADAYRTVYLTTIPFSVIAVALAWYAPNTDHLMTGKVAATLNHEGQLAADEKIREPEA